MHVRRRHVNDTAQMSGGWFDCGLKASIVWREAWLLLPGYIEHAGTNNYSRLLMMRAIWRKTYRGYYLVPGSTFLWLLNSGIFTAVER